MKASWLVAALLLAVGCSEPDPVYADDVPGVCGIVCPELYGPHCTCLSADESWNEAHERYHEAEKEHGYETRKLTPKEMIAFRKMADEAWATDPPRERACIHLPLHPQTGCCDDKSGDYGRLCAPGTLGPLETDVDERPPCKRTELCGPVVEAAETRPACIPVLPTFQPDQCQRLDFDGITCADVDETERDCWVCWESKEAGGDE